MLTGPSLEFCSLIERNFERANDTGAVQVISEEPADCFVVSVERSSLTCADGTADNATATIVMRGGVIRDIVAKKNSYDSRVLDFSWRLSFTGYEELAHFVLNLVKTPSTAVQNQLYVAGEICKERSCHHIARIHCPDDAVLLRLIAESQPAVLTGLLNEWRVETWSAAALESEFGRYQMVSYLPWTVRDYTRPTNPRYTTGVGLPGVLWKHFPAPASLRSVATLGFPQLWLGASERQERSVTGLHADTVQGFLCHVFGRKRILLYSPDQESLVYPLRAFNTYRSCWTGPDAIDYQTYPRFRDAHALEVILEAGEVLFIPLGWFHCVFALDLVMSISYPVERYQPTPAQLKYAARASAEGP